jgi:hypothetical protein
MVAPAATRHPIRHPRLARSVLMNETLSGFRVVGIETLGVPRAPTATAGENRISRFLNPWRLPQPTRGDQSHLLRAAAQSFVRSSAIGPGLSTNDPRAEPQVSAAHLTSATMGLRISQPLGVTHVVLRLEASPA